MDFCLTENVHFAQEMNSNLDDIDFAGKRKNGRKRRPGRPKGSKNKRSRR